MYILGISCFYHDSSACILKDGKIIAAAEEERFSRKKHDTSFPINAINYCLKEAGITGDQLDYVGFYEKPFLKFERLLHQHIEMFPRSFKTFYKALPSWINEKLRVPSIVKKKLKYKKGVLFVEHHMSHAASSYLVSPFKESAILTVDGVGEWATTTMGHAKGNDITLLKQIDFPHSLGLLYSAVTAFLGMSVNNSEYKCIHPETEILLANGSLIKIKETFNLNGKKQKIGKDEEIINLSKPITILSLDKNKLKFRPTKTKTAYRKKANTSLIKVQFNSGREVIVTPNHKFSTVNLEGETITIEAKQLNKNDLIITPSKIKTKSSNKKYKNWAKILAYSVAESHEMIRKSKHEAEIRFATIEKELSKDFDKVAENLGKKSRKWKTEKNLNYSGLSVWKELDFFKKELGYHFGNKSGNKKIPGFIFNSNKEIKKVFLQTLFDCDGSFVGHQVIYATKSEVLANQITYLLLNFGIFARIRKIYNKKYQQNYYRVEINGKDLTHFEKEISFKLKRKKQKLIDYLKKAKKIGNNLDTIPINNLLKNIWIDNLHKYKKDFYKEIGAHFWEYESKKRYPSPSIIKKLYKKYKLKELKKFVENDIFFDKIKSVKKLKFKGHVYDLLVPKDHTFIGGFGGLVLHNTMGLAPYGKPKYYEKFKKLIDVKEDGSYALDMSYFDFHYKMTMPSKKFIKLFGPIRKPESEVTQYHKDMAATLQKITEETIFKMLNYLHETTKCDKLCMAGGCALNSVANGKILSNTPFKEIYIQPAAGDGGTSIGVAKYIYNTILGNERKEVQETAYFGPEFSREEIKKFLDSYKVNYTEFKDDEEIIKETAKLIHQDNVIGWFQGRMEWGPRALGSRSILSNAGNPKMQDILNLKVKHREKFRPFAPVVPEEDAKKYFKCDEPIPIPTDFMLMVYPIKKEYHSKIPSVTHVDGSGRLQTIRKQHNKLYHGIMKEFKKMGEIPILVNTSFNIRGEPIVCEPLHAYRCMMGTGIDCLVMDKFLIKRKDNPQHRWDSEKYAKD